MMVCAMPSVTIEEAVDDMLRVPKFSVSGYNSRKLGTRLAHKIN